MSYQQKHFADPPALVVSASDTAMSHGADRFFFSAQDILVRLRAPQVDITQRVVGKLPIAPSANPQGDKFAHPDSVHGSNALFVEAGPWNANKNTSPSRTAAATRTSTAGATNGPRIGTALPVAASVPTGSKRGSRPIYGHGRGGSPCCELSKSFWSTNSPEMSGATADAITELLTAFKELDQ